MGGARRTPSHPSITIVPELAPKINAPDSESLSMMGSSQRPSKMPLRGSKWLLWSLMRAASRMLERPLLTGLWPLLWAAAAPG
jgi:hypothetical protein